MKLKCPECASPEVKADPSEDVEKHRCGNCGARFPRDSALLTVLEAEAYRGQAVPRELFAFNPPLAATKLREGDGVLSTVSPYSDTEELERLLDAAQTVNAIESERPYALIEVYPLSVSARNPVLAVNTGGGLIVLGSELHLRQEEDEDPIAFTVRFLWEVVSEANALAAGRAADSARLDRIATFMNEHRPWESADICDFLQRELGESGRRILEEHE